MQWIRKDHTTRRSRLRMTRALVALVFCLGPTLRAARLIWVSDNSTPVAGIPADKGWVDLLRAEGYTVDYRGEEGAGSPDYQYWRTLDAAKISELNAADLVLISRNTDSQYYDDGSEIDQWNAIEAPILSLSAFMSRSNRWGWINTASTVIANAPMEVLLPDHPVVKGVTLSPAHQVTAVTSSIDSFAVSTEPGNGTLIARRADNGQVWIVEWPVDVEFYDGSGRTAAGKRMYLAAASSINLTNEGQTLFLNAVRYLLGSVTSQASKPLPADKATDVPRDVILAWKPGPFAATHDVYFGTTDTDVSSGHPLGVSQGQDANTYEPAGPLAFGRTYYWRVDEVNAPPDSTVIKGQVWSFTIEPYAYPITTPIQATASSSSSTLTGPEKTIDRSGLNANDQHSTIAADMWSSLSSGPIPIWIQYEFDRVYKLHEMWVWNSNQLLEPDFGLGAKEVVIEVSTDGVLWTVLTGVPEFAQATAMTDYLPNTTVEFRGAMARFVKLTVNSNWGGAKSSGLSEVRFFTVPLKAFEPQPASGATGVALDATLNWRPGREAATHEVSLGTDPNALSKVATVTGHTYALGSAGLEYGRTYYWKVDEVNDAASPTSWAGDLWSFSTIEYTAVENFELYDDTCNRIFYGWADGYGVGSPECGGSPVAGNGSGSTVGNTSAPYAERAIVHGGSQSMPLFFDNTMGPYYSETNREWATPQVWTTGGANTLKVFFRGEAPAFLETTPGNIVMSGMGTDIWNTVDQGRFAYKTLTGDGSITARVDSLANTNAWAKAGVMIRETLDSGSTCAYVLYAGTNGAHFQARLSTGVAAISDTTLTLPADQTEARAPVWVKVERKGNQFFGYYATDAAGSAWTPMAWNPQTIPMASTVYIGLAVTSHAADIVCGARLSSVSAQGNVSGSWLLADLAVTQPTGGNAPETFYVALQDGSGKMKAISHPDPVAIATGSWEEWNVLLSQFTSAGVSLSNVKKLIIGIGDRNAPKAGGSGKLYIDDIRLTRLGP